MPITNKPIINWGALTMENMNIHHKTLANMVFTDMQGTFGHEKANYDGKQREEHKKNKIGDLFSYKRLSKYEGLLGKKEVRAPTTFVGVEVELEKVEYKRNPPASCWTDTDDGSLKEKGREFVSIPIPVKYLEVELLKLLDSLFFCQTSTRCSIHVHLNVRDFTLQELEKFLILYLIFERSLYRFSGDRWNNNFCVPLRFYPLYISNMFFCLKRNELSQEWLKYHGLNLSPIFGGESTKLGTIEFRQMEGTIDVDRIMDWVNLIVSLKISAKAFKYEDLVNEISLMNTTSSYHMLAEKTFKFCNELITKQPTFKEDIESSISFLKLVYQKEEKKEDFEVLIPL
ncbi:putative amidoligase enzyme [Caudoviricetes sp.]|nr:putative amidoligase enzyme [Caudoviricetes sp.]